VRVPYTPAAAASIGAQWSTTSHPRPAAAAAPAPGSLMALAQIGAEQLIAHHKKGHKDHKDHKMHGHEQTMVGAPIAAAAPASRPAHSYPLEALLSRQRGLVRLDLPPIKSGPVRFSAVSAAGQRTELVRGRYVPIGAGVHSIEIDRGNGAPVKLVQAALQITPGNEYAVCRDGKTSVRQVLEQAHGQPRTGSSRPIASAVASPADPEAARLLAQYAPTLKPVANSVMIVHWQNGAAGQMAVAPIGEFLRGAPHLDDYSLRANNGLEYSVHPSNKHVWDAEFNEVPVRALFAHPASPSTTVLVIDHATMPSF
jgi:hypothetical protein